MDKLTVIIPAAGESSRMKTYGPKPLIKVKNDEYLILRQIRLIKEVYHNIDIYVVVGCEADKIYNILPSDVHVVENQLFKETNVVKSISLGIKASLPKKLLIVYGDLVFNKETIESINLNESSVLIDNGKNIRKDEVGVITYNNYVTAFHYGHKTKWCQITYLHEKELDLFSKIVHENDNKRLYGFEVLNKIIDVFGNISANTCNGMKIVEIDSSRDIALAMKIK